MKKVILAFSALLMVLAFISCDSTTKKEQPGSELAMEISEQEVLDAQKIWGEGIVQIGNVYSADGDYTAAAEKHIDELYGYNLGTVLFKPTMASIEQFRTTKEGALS